MGDSIKAAYEAIEDYENLCDYWEIERRPTKNFGYYDMYGHEEEIFSKLGVKHIYDFNKKVSELKSEGWTKETIKDFYNIK